MSSTVRSRTSFPIAVFVSWATLCAPVTAWAQQPPNQPPSPAPSSIPADAINKLSSDLATLQAGIQATPQLSASPAVTEQVEVTRDTANVLQGADASASTAFVVKKGDKFYVLDRAKDFYAIATANGNTGWIAPSDVKPVAVQINPPGILASSGQEQVYRTSGEGAGQGKVYTGYYTVGSTPNIPHDNSITERIYNTLTEQAVRFRDSYKDNPYMYVSGFTVHVGIPPSVDLAFTFR